ncbi:MAG: hypothetical protein IJI25_12020 [Eubacterium sp.]|nr:hypothetical protein [Eubacterium sp.]
MSAIAVSEYANLPAIGYMPMPVDFPYFKIMLQGRPRHEGTSEFRRKHPKMPCSRRAKIFAPFDALAGFDERIANKEVLYEERRMLTDNEQEELNRKISILHDILQHRKNGRKVCSRITVTYFSPCTDIESDSYGVGGNYITYTGYIQKIDIVITKMMVIDDIAIPLDYVIDLSGDLYERNQEFSL